jgi:cobalt-zinc-cadmium resistance protein CzcA
MIALRADFRRVTASDPFIGGEFLPHLDEGALWVRATMPYTISFEDASKLRPKVMAILKKYPQVTVLARSLAARRRHRPHRLFQRRVLRGLKPYNDKTWKQGSIHNQGRSDRRPQKKLTSFPGVIFNYTQPAEDAVDEALTGLKSALAVKVFGPI